MCRKPCVFHLKVNCKGFVFLKWERGNPRVEIVIWRDIDWVMFDCSLNFFWYDQTNACTCLLFFGLIPKSARVNCSLEIVILRGNWSIDLVLTKSTLVRVDNFSFTYFGVLNCVWQIINFRHLQSICHSIFGHHKHWK